MMVTSRHCPAVPTAVTIEGMKILDLTLNSIIALSAAVFLAYIGLDHYDYGLFTTLPDEVTGFFLRNDVLQYVALGLLATAMIAKAPAGRARKRQDA
jgi:hypothetical protein